MQFDGFHLSRSPARQWATVADHDGFLVRAPVLEPHDIVDICDDLLAARQRLQQVSVRRVIAAIDAAARRLLDPHDPARVQVLRGLSAITGYSPPMAQRVLDGMAADWRAPVLEQLVTAELGGTDAIDAFLTRPDGSRTRAVGVPLGLHVFSGNVPGVSVTSMVRALLVRSAVLGKTAAGEPVLAPAFARLLAEADPLVGDCVAVTYWPGGEERLEAAALERVGLVVHYGGEAAVASLRARAPARVRFVEHGPRVSCAVIHAAHFTGAASPALLEAARDTAAAVAVFDQQGCVSPQFACVIGDEGSASAFAAALAAALEEVQRELPRGRMEPGEAAAVHDLRTAAEFRAIAGDPVQLWSGEGLAWTVILDAAAEFTGSCLNRTIVVNAAASVEDLLHRLRPFGDYLQTVGVAGFSSPDMEPLAIGLAEIGATRITPIPAMPWPPAAWHHDGRGPLSELVRWTDLEQVSGTDPAAAPPPP